MSTTNALSNSFLRRGFVVLAVFLASCGVRMSEIDPGASANRPFGCAVFDNAVFFSAFDRTSGFELWKSDGTEAGTVRVKDINPGASGSIPGGFTVFNNALYFSAFDATSGFELWRSDGTEAGTVRVKDINPGPGGSSPFGFTISNNALYFSADDGTNGFELWKSDGTEPGTVRVNDIFPCECSTKFRWNAQQRLRPPKSKLAIMQIDVCMDRRKAGNAIGQAKENEKWHPTSG